MLAHAGKHLLTVLAWQSPQQLTSPRPRWSSPPWRCCALHCSHHTKCAVAAGRPALMGGLSPALCYRLTVLARYAENVTNIGVDKISAPAKISLIFAKLQQSISLLTGVLSKIGKSKKRSPSLSNISFSTLDLHTEAITESSAWAQNCPIGEGVLGDGRRASVLICSRWGGAGSKHTSHLL